MLVEGARCTVRLVEGMWRRRRGESPLHGAGSGGHVAVLRELAEPADVNAQAVDGVTPLHLAADGGHVESARALLELGANV
jgi:ankyrin repeat protein